MTEETVEVTEEPLTVETQEEKSSEEITEETKDNTVIEEESTTEDPAKVEDKEEPKVLTPQERNALLTKFANTIKSFNKEINANGADFSAISARYVSAVSAEDKPVKYQKIETAIDRENFPEDLKENMQLIGRVFNLDKEENPVTTFKTIDGFWFVRLIEIVEPKPMNFDEAKDILKEKMIAEKSLDKIKSELEEAKNKLSSSTADGPTIKAAAEKNGYNVSRYSYNLKSPPADSEVDSELLRRAVLGTVATKGDETTKPGTIAGKISETLMDTDGGMIVYIAEKSLKSNPLETEVKREISSRIRKQNIDLRFRSWLIEQRKYISNESRNLYLKLRASRNSA